MGRGRQVPTVAVLGGGVGGMSAAHELAERGFRVTVYEARQTPGGKARSCFVPGTGRGGRRGLPGEHGFRFFPSFYRHLPDTMKRIPFGKNKEGVFDNLVGTDRTRVMRESGDWFDMVTHFPLSIRDLRTMSPSAWYAKMGIPPEDTREFLRRTYAFLTSCQERRLAQYEDVTYWDFLDCDKRSEAFQLYFGEVAVQALVAMQPRMASARTTVTIGLQLWLDHLKPGTRVARVLSGPTFDAWLGPWLEYLKQRDVDYRFGTRISSLRCRAGRIAGVMLEDGSEITADYYVAALPAERMAELVDAPLREAAPELGGIGTLTGAWMSGVQFFLKRELTLAAGHAILVDSPWALTAISQRQYWRPGVLTSFGDGTAQGVISLCISDWDKPGRYVKKTARQCTRDEIRHEVWRQLQAHVAGIGEGRLEDDEQLDWYLADSIEHRPDGEVVNHEPLLINTVGSWWRRPDAVTRIPNLVLAADYVRTHTDIATMESANEAARRAVNGILAESGSSARPCEVWPFEEPDIFAPQRALDAWRFRRGLPHSNAELLGDIADRPAAPRDPAEVLGARQEPKSTRQPAHAAPRVASEVARVLSTGIQALASDVDLISSGIVAPSAAPGARPEDVDVLVVGAGPAGTATALELARMGARWAKRVLVIDRAVFPRDKLCGGAVTHLGERILRRMGLRFEPSHVPVREVRVSRGGRTASFRGDPVLRITRRDVFDHWLLRQAEAAGVEVRQGVSLRSLRQDADHVHVDTDAGALRAKVIVAADGSRSVVRKLLGWRDHAHLARLLEVLTPGKADAPAFRDGVAAFEFGNVGSGLAGYYWDFPSLVNGVPVMNRGVFDGRSERSGVDASLKSALARSLSARGLDLGTLELKSHPIRTFNPHGALSAPRVLLTGDAAGVDPLYGEGISFALAYGEVAAGAIADAFAGGRFDFIDYRCRVRRHALLGQLPMRVRMARFGAHLTDPRVLAAMWSLGSRGLSLTRWSDPGYVPALDETAWMLRA